jgi:peptidyl-prolyl cis-trans isomerase D
MISWMQHNNKYLVITIWVATIAFIGAGFVGWGSVNFGVKSSSIAKVGDIPVSKVKYQFTYSNLYNQYAQKLGANNFDQEKAKSLGLDKIAFRNLYNEALLLNMANEYGVIVTAQEIAQEIEKFDIFKDKDGNINKSIYENFLRARGLKAKDFEAIIGDELRVRKLLALIHVKPMALEKQAMESTFNIADKIRYKLLKSSDVNVSVDENELKEYWQKNRMNYLTKTKYELEILVTKADNMKLSQKDLEAFYKENSFNYIDKEGKVIDFNSSIENVKKDLTLKKLKKQAILDRNRFKKGKLAATQKSIIDEGNTTFPQETWKIIKSEKVGNYLKPQVVGDKYYTIHILQKIEPKEMNFEEAKPLVSKEYAELKKSKELEKLASDLEKSPEKLTNSVKEFLTLSKFQTINNLTPQDSLKLIRHIFGSAKKIDKVRVSDGIVVYEVVEQKLLDNNSSSPTLSSEVAAIKNGELDSNLLKELSGKFSTELYVKGLQ